jgi:hypothetical protein
VLAENLDALKCWWLGGIYSPNHQSGHWEGLLSYGAPDSPVRHRTLSGVPATSPNRWGSTVGALTCGATGQFGGAPDRSCSLSGAPSGACSDFCVRSCTVHVHCRLLQTTVGAVSRCSTGTPDSPVNYSGVAPQIPEAEQFKGILPGAPDTVRWHIGQSGAPDQGNLRLSFALFI